MSAITTHVLDTALGRPGAAVPVRLERVAHDAAGATVGTTEVLAETVTDAGGRVADLGPERIEAGTYRLVFDLAAYYSATAQRGFFPEAVLTFTVTDPTEHYHVPLLLSPFAYSTYRGS